VGVGPDSAPRVLFAHDDTAFREELARMLRRAGLRVTEAVNWDALLQRLEEETPDLLVIPALMHSLTGVQRDVDGFSISQLVKPLVETGQMKLAMLIAQPSEVDCPRVWRDGHATCIVRPGCSAVDIADALTRVLTDDA
jgi:CheY-like chemotaxis protein